MSTTPIASAHVCTSTAPPSNWVGNIAPGTRCKDDNAQAWDNPFSSDHTFYVDGDRRTMGTAQLHAHGYPECRGLWRVMVRQFLNGRQWDHRTWAVIDDFGWLVEVPAR